MKRQRRFSFLTAACVVCATSLGLPAYAPAQGLDDLTGSWQLFVDDYIVAAKTGVTRTYHPFQKHAGNPVLLPTEPWEDSIAYIYGTVMPDEAGAGYRMWYHTLRPEDTNNDGSNILYAESTDGVHWVKPILNIRSWHGSTANNMIYVRPTQSGITSVIHTPWDPDPDKQYRLMNWEPNGFWGAYSNDGLHTFDLANNPVITQAGDVGQFMYDPHTGLYRGYVKLNSDVNGLRRRSLGLTSTTEIDFWPVPELILEVDSYDDRWVPPGTVQRTHIYGMSTFAYESMYMGLAWIFRATDIDGYYIGPVYAEITSSHDGAHWTREEAPRPAMLPLGSPGAWDDGQLYTARAPIRVGDELWIYYGACDDVHGTATKKLNCAIGLAKLRKDGFASLDAGPSPGTITTRKILGASGPLHVNYTAAAGSVKVELLDANGDVLPGYSQADCVPLTGDSVEQLVTWSAHSELPGGFDPISLRFIVQNAALYSFDPGEAAQVVNSPAITQQPLSRTVALGGSATFVITAIGDPPLDYQWRKDGQNIADGGHYAGATTATLTITNAALTDAGNYRCVVTNPFGSAVSEPAALTVDPVVPIQFLETWDTYAIETGDPVYIARWAGIPGTNRYPIQAWDTLSPPNTAKVTKEVALGISHPLATELAAAVPGATEVRGTDANPLLVLYQLYLNTLNSYASADVFVELAMGEVHAPASNSSTVLPVLAFGMTAGLHGSAAYPRFFDGKNWNNVAGLSVGNGWHYLSMAVEDATVQLQAGGSATLPRLYPGGFDRISFRSGFNTVQWRALGDVSLTGGMVVPPVNTPTIADQPEPQATCPGASATFGVNASGSGTLSYQWRKNGFDITDGGHFSGATTTTLTISSVDANDIANYRCVVSNAGGSIFSDEVPLTLKPTGPTDLDQDCDVDADDLPIFVSCGAGPAVPPTMGCQPCDFDGDGDVDQSDFGVFQNCYTGAGGLIDSACAN